MTVSRRFGSRQAIRAFALSVLVAATFGLAAESANAAVTGGTVVVTVTLPGGALATDGCVYIYDGEGFGEEIGSACDQPTGVYSIPIPDDGSDYDVELNFAGYPYQAIPGTYWYWPGTTLVTVAGGATVNLSYQLKATEWSISGTLLDVGAVPADGWEVFLATSQGVIDSVQTQADGSYDVTGLPAGDYYLGFGPANDDPRSTWYEPEWYGGALSRFGSSPIHITVGQNVTVNYQIQRAQAEPEAAVVAAVPRRLADVSSFTPGVVRCYDVPVNGGVPWSAGSVILNVTAAGAHAPGNVLIYPDYDGTGRSLPPNASTVNFEPGADVANSATVALPDNGRICAFSQGATLSRLILDVTGYILPGSGITVQNSARLVDTRAGGYHVGSVVGPVEPLTPYTVQVTDQVGVPAGATAVLANVTVTGATSGGHLRMWAAGTAMPNTSVVNYAPGQTKANGQIIALSPSGQLSFASMTGAGTGSNPVHVIIDVVGYVQAGAQLVVTAPTRVVETRAAYGIIGPITGTLTPVTIYPVTIGTSLVPANATAVVLNVTAVGPTGPGHLRVYPDTNGLGTTPPPDTSSINYIPGRDIPNMITVQLPADRTIDFYNVQGGANRTNMVVDVIGYIVPATT